MRRITRRQDTKSICPGRLELGEGARHGLDGQAEIIRDVLARHRQVEGVAADALAEIQEEGGQPFAGGVTAEQEHVRLGALKLLEQGADRGLGALFVQEGVAAHHLQGGLSHRLGPKRVPILAVQAEDVAAGVEFDDLAAAVRQHAVGAHHPGDHAVDMAAGLALAEDPPRPGRSACAPPVSDAAGWRSRKTGRAVSATMVLKAIAFMAALSISMRQG
ncbi:MAG: hypothetical protein WDN45_16295 [Caulobacteraceae bacterium]